MQLTADIPRLARRRGCDEGARHRGMKLASEEVGCERCVEKQDNHAAAPVKQQRRVVPLRMRRHVAQERGLRQ